MSPAVAAIPRSTAAIISERVARDGLVAIAGTVSVEPPLAPAACWPTPDCDGGETALETTAVEPLPIDAGAAAAVLPLFGRGERFCLCDDDRGRAGGTPAVSVMPTTPLSNCRFARLRSAARSDAV